MPTVEQNLKTWNNPAIWQQRGDEWSVTWGGAETQCYGALYPRVHAYVPAGTILEIAPGYGRWTHYLKEYCTRLVAVDLSETCIAECKKRFAASTNIEYHVNDGRSLSMIDDGSIDFAFSFDSLVHAELDVIEAYVGELSRKLKPDGVAFIHHSNAGEYRRWISRMQKLPYRLRQSLNLINYPHWRGLGVTAGAFERIADANGLVCISQEMVNRGSRLLVDCFSAITPLHSRWARLSRRCRNRDLMTEARLIAATSSPCCDTASRSP